MAPATDRTIADLTDDERSRLEAALADLRDAVERYEPYLATEPLAPGREVQSMDLDAMGAAQNAVQAAEQWLWQLRGDLLGDNRPASAPSAASTAEWFSPEDAAYDELDVETQDR